MKESNSKILCIATLWVSVLLLQCQVIKTDDYTFLTASKGEIKSHSYPQKYQKGYYHEWHIKVSRGYRIRLQFRDFDVGRTTNNCRQSGDNLEVWNGGNSPIFLCGQKLPAIIESKGRDMSIYMNHVDNLEQSTRGRFWAHYEIFSNVHPTTTSSTEPETMPITKQGYFTQGSPKNSVLTNQHIFLLGSIGMCFIVAACFGLYCGCKKRRRPVQQTPVPDNTDPEIQDEILELGFGDPPPSYEEVTRQSLPDVIVTEQPSGRNKNEGIDSTGLPSYREALNLSRQSLDRNL